MKGHLAFLRHIAAWLAAVFLTAAAHGQLPQPGRNAIASNLIAETAVVVPGKTVTLALTMRPSKGWHG